MSSFKSQEAPQRGNSLTVAEKAACDHRFSRCEPEILELAMNLLGDEDAARRVAAQVCERLVREIYRHPQESLDVLVHRFTYDAALPLLIQGTHADWQDIEACCPWLTDAKKRVVL